MGCLSHCDAAMNGSSLIPISRRTARRPAVRVVQRFRSSMTFGVLPVCKALSTSAYFGVGSSALTIVLTLTANSKDTRSGGRLPLHSIFSSSSTEQARRSQVARWHASMCPNRSQVLRRESNVTNSYVRLCTVGGPPGQFKCRTPAFGGSRRKRSRFVRQRSGAKIKRVSKGESRHARDL